MKIVRVEFSRRLLPDLKSKSTAFHRIETDCGETAKASGENIARKHPLDAAGWTCEVKVVTEAQFRQEVACD